mgnify:CR=1 FL=1
MPLKNKDKRREYNQKYLEEHRDRLNAQHRLNRKLRPILIEHNHLANKRRHTMLRIKALVAYSGLNPKCACCGEQHTEFLAIDHIDGGGNIHRKENKLGHFYYWLESNNYPAGFRVLCHNCNLSLGFYGYCPHIIPDKNILKVEG